MQETGILQIEVRPADARRENAALRALWASKWVEMLEDERAMSGGKVLAQAITDLGLAYDLLTTFTSFVAIDSEIVNRGGSAQTVRQALPMPAGVPNTAVGTASVGGGLGMHFARAYELRDRKSPHRCIVLIRLAVDPGEAAVGGSEINS